MDSTTSALTRRSKGNHNVKQSSVSEERVHIVRDRRGRARSGAEKAVMRKVAWLK